MSFDIRDVPLDELNLSDYNPRLDLQPGDHEYESLKRSFEQFGQVEPLVYNQRTDRLVGGHQRVKVMRDLGYESAYVAVVDLEEGKEKALNLALNRIQGDWDNQALAQIVDEIARGDDLDVDVTGFTDDEVTDLIKRLQNETNGDFITAHLESLPPEEEMSHEEAVAAYQSEINPQHAPVGGSSLKHTPGGGAIQVAEGSEEVDSHQDPDTGEQVVDAVTGSTNKGTAYVSYVVPPDVRDRAVSAIRHAMSQDESLRTTPEGFAAVIEAYFELHPDAEGFLPEHLRAGVAASQSHEA